MPYRRCWSLRQLEERADSDTPQDNGEPVVLLGDSGTGKTYLLIGLGLAACEQGRRVRYVTTASSPANSSKQPMTASCPAWSAATAT